MELYQHFRPDEKPFINELMEWAEEVKEVYVPKRSDFLDPRRQYITKAVIGDDEEVKVSLSGGSPHAERKRLLLLPRYHDPDDVDYGLALFSVDYPKKFASISHRDLLGALMNLGLKREKFGDLLLKDGQVQFIIAEEIASYVELNLTKVGNSPVKLERIPLSDMLSVPKIWREQSGTVSSLRLDAVLAEIYHLSRTKSSQWIQRELVKVNWKPIDQPAYVLEAGDELSVRGKGRSKLIAVEGQTKKGKWRILTGTPDENHH